MKHVAALLFALLTMTGTADAATVKSASQWHFKMSCLDTGLQSLADRHCSSQRVESIYMMPPASCMSGPLPAYTIERVSLSALRKLVAEDAGVPMSALGSSKPLGFTDLAHAIVYIRADLHGDIYADALIHEQAHLRGCEHRL